MNTHDLDFYLSVYIFIVPRIQVYLSGLYPGGPDNLLPRKSVVFINRSNLFYSVST